MADLTVLNERQHNRGKIADPAQYAATPSRSAALIYLYAGLKAGASADEVLARARADDAPFVASDELIAWVEQGLAELGGEPS